MCRCSNNSATSPNNNSDMNLALAQVFEIVKSLAVNVTQLTSQVSLLLSNAGNNGSHQVSNQDGSPLSGSITRDNLYVELREYEERKKRSNSIIVKGTAAQSDADFSTTFGNVCQYLLGATPVVNDVFCISRERSIYRVTFQNQDDRVAIVPLAKNLKNNQELSRIFINRDLTYLQRQELIRKRALYRMSEESSQGTITNFLSNDPIQGDQGVGLNRGPLTRSTIRRSTANANLVPINPAGRGTTLLSSQAPVSGTGDGNFQ